LAIAFPPINRFWNASLIVSRKLYISIQKNHLQT